MPKSLFISLIRFICFFFFLFLIITSFGPTILVNFRDAYNSTPAFTIYRLIEASIGEREPDFERGGVSTLLLGDGVRRPMALFGYWLAVFGDLPDVLGDKNLGGGLTYAFT